MNAQIRKAISRTFTFILLTAASFWLFACQASAANGDHLANANPFVTLVAGLGFLMIAGTAHKWRRRICQGGSDGG